MNTSIDLRRDPYYVRNANVQQAVQNQQLQHLTMTNDAQRALNQRNQEMDAGGFNSRTVLHYDSTLQARNAARLGLPADHPQVLAATAEQGGAMQGYIDRHGEFHVTFHSGLPGRGRDVATRGDIAGEAEQAAGGGAGGGAGAGGTARGQLTDAQLTERAIGTATAPGPVGLEPRHPSMDQATGRPDPNYVQDREKEEKWRKDVTAHGQRVREYIDAHRAGAARRPATPAGQAVEGEPSQHDVARGFEANLARVPEAERPAYEGMVRQYRELVARHPVRSRMSLEARITENYLRDQLQRMPVRPEPPRPAQETQSARQERERYSDWHHLYGRGIWEYLGGAIQRGAEMGAE